MTASLPIRSRAAHFDAAVGWHGQTASVTMQGALDFRSAREARQLLVDLLEYEPSTLLVDARRALVDSSGIGVIVHAAQRARQERRDFQLRCGEGLAALLRLHGLAELLGIASSPALAGPGHDRARPLAA
jgi:anti-anti-sigma factor